jgi:hypothetical protein
MSDNMYQKFGGWIFRIIHEVHTVHITAAASNLEQGTRNVITVQAMEALRVVRGWGSDIFRGWAHRWRQGCQTYELAAFYPLEDSWYSFLLESESTPGP